MNIARSNAKASIVIFTNSGSFQEGLKTLLYATHSSLDFWVVDSENTKEWIHKSFHPRLIMIDCAAFWDSGIEFFLRLKEKYTNTKFLVFVGTLREGQEFEKNGADGLLYKGFTNQELEKMITTLSIETEEAQYG